MKKKAWNKILTMSCAAALLMMSPRIIVMADEPHGEETVLTDSYEENEAQEVGAGEVTVGDGVTADFNKKTGVLTFYSKGGTLWKDWHSKMGIEKDAIKSIKVAGTSGLVYMPADSAELFSECRNLASIELEKFDTSKVTNMASMFKECKSLTGVNLSAFNTSKVTDMSYMFFMCEGLTTLDVSSFDTSNVTDMSEMFDGCSGLTNLDLSSFDTSSVTDMYGMFCGCRNLTNLDLSGFDTSNVTKMYFMFTDCTSLTNLDLSSFDTSNVKYMTSMFYDCYSLTNLDLSNFDTSNVTDMAYMFYYCIGLTNLDLSSFNMSNVKDMEDMFYGCRSLQTLITPEIIRFDGIPLPCTMYDLAGTRYTSLPKLTKSIRLVKHPSTNVKSFKDVADSSAWYFDSVYWAVDNDITSGMGEGTFRPMTKLSRAQAVTFLYNLAGKPDVSKLQAKEFTDVSKTAWYYNAVKWAVANKITSGYGTGTFQPNAICNRAMIVTFLANYAKAAGTYREPTTSASFKDVKATDWFRKSVDWAVENGITSGYGQGTFSPNVTCNRAMMVTFLKKVAELRKV